MLYDDLRRDTPGVYRSVLAFLGVDAEFQADFRILNAAKRVRSETLRDLLKRPPAWIPAIGTRLLSRNLRLKLLGAVIELNSKYERRPRTRAGAGEAGGTRLCDSGCDYDSAPRSNGWASWSAAT